MGIVENMRCPGVNRLLSRDNRFITTTMMFKTAATIIAHNPTIPALAGNSRLQPLQESDRNRETCPAVV